MKWQLSDPSPALFVPPPGVVSLDEAHLAIEQWEHYSGKVLDSAQRLAVELMMAEDGSGCWAARTTGRAESRQNGKGDEIEVVEAYGLTQRAEAIVHTAHEIPTSKSAHLRLVAHLQGHRDLRRKVGKVRYANGDQAIEMVNGGIAVYRTRTGGGGRGLDDISRLVVDEAQHAQGEQLASSTPILAANPNPQTNLIGSGGIADKSALWWEQRLRAIRGDVGQFSWLEHSAEAVSFVSGELRSIPPDPFDRDAWRRANPGFPSRIADGYLLEQLALLGPALFAREHLCVWDPPPLGADGVPVPSDVWRALEDVESSIVSARMWSVVVSPNRQTATIGVAGRRADGRLHVEVREGFDRQSIRDLMARLVAAWSTLQIPLRVHASGPEAALITPLREKGVEVVEVSTSELAQATGQFLDAVNADGLRHPRQPSLDAALAGAALRMSSDSASVWSQRQSQVEITPLVAVTVALGGVPAADNVFAGGLTLMTDFDD